MTEDLTGQIAIRDDQPTEAVGSAEMQDDSRSEGSETLVGQAGETVVVTRPAPGQTVEIQAVAGQTYVLDFPPGDARVQADDGDLILGFDDNGDGTIDSRIVFLELAQAAETGDAPLLRIAGNDVDAGVLYRQALALGGEEGPPPLDDVAAGPGALGGGGTYDDDLGSTIDLLAAQGIIPPTELQFGLIDLEDEILLDEEDDLPPGAENTPPEADPVLTPASQADGGEGGLPSELEDALNNVNVQSATVTVTGSGEAGSVQYVLFTLTEPTAVTITTDGPTIDPHMFLFVDDGSLDAGDALAEDDDDGLPAGFFSNAVIETGDEIGVLPAGNYIIAVADYELTLAEAVAGINDSSSFGSLTGDVTVTVSQSVEPSDVVLFKQLTVDGDIGDDDSGVVADFGGADGETALGDLTFTLQSNPTYGQLILVTSGGATSFLNVGDSFSSADTVWWIATQDQIDDFLSSEGAPEFLPNVTFDYSVTDADGASATAPVTITLPRDVTPPEVALSLPDQVDCIAEDSTTADASNEVTVTVTPQGDDLLTEIVLDGFQADWTYDLTGLDTDGAGDGVVVTDNGDGTVTITFASPSNDTYTGSFDVQPPADSDVDHPTITATATVADPADPSLTASNDGTLDIHVDANADGGEGSAGDDGDGVHLSVALAVADGSDDNATFQAGETGTLTVSATFDDFQDGSETHTVTVTAPAGFEIGEVVGSLPAGVTVSSNDGSTLILSVDSQDGDGQDGVGDFSVTFSVTNVDALGGTAEFTAEAKAVETSTGDVECDPSDADNVATVTTDATATVANLVPPTVTLSLPDEVDCIAEDSTTADANNVVSLAVTAQGDDELTEIVISGLDPDWTYDFAGLETDGATLTDSDVSDGSITLSVPNLAAYAGSFAVQPPADSDVDHPTITASATAVDPTDPALSATGEGTLDVHVDAVADPVTVNITVNDSGDDNDTFQPNETGTVHVNATFGDHQDGSETHRVTVAVPAGFLIGALVSLPDGVTFDLSLDGEEVTFNIPTGEAGFNYSFDVTAPDTVTNGQNFTFEATATATETNTPATSPGDVECSEDNNLAQDDDSDLVYGGVENIDPVLIVGENVDDIAGETTPHHVHLPPAPTENGEIVGGDAQDILIGDVGGGALDGKTMNLVLILDTSDSMEEQIEFNSDTMMRIEALDKAVESLLDKLAGTPGLTVRLHMVSFNTDVTGEATFDIITNGVVNEAALQDAKDFILDADDVPSTVAQGNTNYEAGFQAALDWFNDDANTLDDPDFNKTIFVSDGLPNRVYQGNSTSQVVIEGSTQRAIDHVLGTFTHPSNPALDDTVSEYDGLLGAFKGVHGTVDAIGINVDGAGVAVLSQVDQDDADSIDEGQELADALDGLSEVTQLAAVGDDVIIGNGANDLIFGDAIYTDTLADEEGITLPPGSGWAVIDALIDNGTSTEEIIALLRDRAYEFGRESVNSEGEGREGGNDTIDGGGGHDLIFGQEGDDLIDGGAGEDTIIGGTGDDTMTGGTDEDTFVWTSQFIAGETDTVTDFVGAGGDRLDLSALLQGTDPGDTGNELQDYLSITWDGANTTISIDVNGGGDYTDVSIVCVGVDLTAGGGSQADIINTLLTSGQLEAGVTV